MRITLILMACWALASTPAVAQERLPVPAPAAQRQAERSLRDANKAAYASKWSSEKLALAKTLFERARRRQDDEAGQFVAYREACLLAVQASNLDLGLEAARECAGRFEVAMFPMAIDALTAAGKLPHGAAETRSIVQTCLRIAQEAAAAEDVDSATKAVNLASTLARPLKDSLLLTAATSCSTEVSELRSWLARVANARTTLQTSPDDATAHRLLGEYEALRHANWDAGLDHLRRGDDAELKALALRDRAAGDDLAILADAWWDLGEHLTGLMRHNARQRALSWYEKTTEGGVPVLLQTRIIERLAILRVERLTCNWLPVDDPRFLEPDEDSRLDSGRVTILPTGTSMARTYVNKLPYDVDGISVRVRPGQGPKVQAYLVYELERECIVYDRAQSIVAAAWQSKPLYWDHHVEHTPNSPDEICMAVVLVASEAVVYVDGVEVGRVPTKLRVLNSVSLQACFGSSQFDQIKVRRKSW